MCLCANSSFTTFVQPPDLYRYRFFSDSTAVEDCSYFTAADEFGVWCCRSADGQIWGLPVYDWRELERTDFRWWKVRTAQVLAPVVAAVDLQSLFSAAFFAGASRACPAVLRHLSNRSYVLLAFSRPAVSRPSLSLTAFVLFCGTALSDIVGFFRGTIFRCAHDWRRAIETVVIGLFIFPEYTRAVWAVPFGKRPAEGHYRPAELDEGLNEGQRRLGILLPRPSHASDRRRPRTTVIFPLPLTLCVPSAADKEMNTRPRERCRRR